MNRKEWNAQGRQSDDTVIVLRRRARDLESEYSEAYVSVFLRAADELQARRYAAIPGGEEQLVVNAIADNRRLRNVLVRIFEQIRARQPQGWPDQVMTLAKQTLAAVRPFGEGRRIMSIQIGNDATREGLEATIAELLDAHFNEGQHGHKESTTDAGTEGPRAEAGEAEEPAGRDAQEHQVESDQEGSRGAEGGAAGEGPRSGERAGPASGATD